MKKDFGYVTDREGNAVAGANIYVRKQADSSLLTLYSDNGITSTSNPLTTDNDGEYSFYTADNVIKVQTFVDGVQQQEVNQVQHYDLSVITPFVWTIFDDASAAAVRTTLGIALGTDVQAYDPDLAVIAGLADPNADRILFWDDSAGSYAYLAASTGLSISTTNLAVDLATTAQYRANTATKVLSTDQVWAAADYVALTDAATVDVDMSAGFNFSVTLAGNRTLGAPTNTKNGQTGAIVITQDGTGTRTLAYHANWKFASGTDPVLSTTAAAVDILFYQVISATSIYGTLVKAIA